MQTTSSRSVQARCVNGEPEITHAFNGAMCRPSGPIRLFLGLSPPLGLAGAPSCLRKSRLGKRRGVRLASCAAELEDAASGLVLPPEAKNKDTPVYEIAAHVKDLPVVQLNP